MLASSFAKELDAARMAARCAGEVALRYWSQGIAFESKQDDSPVTVADRDCEQVIARLLEERFPNDALVGEEGTVKSSHSGRRWIIDPIDGTRDFVRGNPAWAVLIGFEAQGDVVAGCAYLPAVGDVFFASRGGGAFLNDKPVRVSEIDNPQRAVLCINGLNALTKFPFASRLLDWMDSFWAVRSMGGCLDAMMVARGQADLWIEPSAKAWDLAAPKIIVEEAGGRFFNFDGGNSIYAGNCVLCAPGLEQKARELLCQC